METCKKCGYALIDGWIACPVCGTRTVIQKTGKKRGNGQGTAIKRGKTWTGIKPGYKYTGEDGKRHRKRPTKGGFPTKRDALAWAASAAATADDPAPRLIDLWEGWSRNDMLKLSNNKQCAYRIARRRLEPIIAREIDSLTVDDLQDVINNTCNTYYPAKDCKNLLSHFYKRAMASNKNKGRITQNLSEFIVLPPLNEKEAAPLTTSEVAKLWTAYESGNRVAGYVLVMIYTGMMPGELLECQKSMVDLDAHEIRGAGLKTKTRKQTAIAFPAFLAPVLADLMARSASVKLCAINKDNFYTAFYEAIEAAGIDNPPTTGEDGKIAHRITPYSCRHTYGTEAVKMGLHPAVIQQMLRHSNTKTQEKYTHLGGDALHAAVEQIQKAQ